MCRLLRRAHGTSLVGGPIIPALICAHVWPSRMWPPLCRLPHGTCMAPLCVVLCWPECAKVQPMKLPSRCGLTQRLGSFTGFPATQWQVAAMFHFCTRLVWRPKVDGDGPDAYREGVSTITADLTYKADWVLCLHDPLLQPLRLCTSIMV